VLLAATLIVTWFFRSIANGVATSLTFDLLKTGQADLGSSVRTATVRMPSIWVAGLIAGVLVALGFVALVVPGIILNVMFALIIPVIVIEKAGPLQSLGRSRQLVGHRWGKTFGLLLVLGLIVGVLGYILGLVSGLFGAAHTLVNDVLNSVFLPLSPIGMTIYYYSMTSRLEGERRPQSVPIVAAGYCPSCGQAFEAGQRFCIRCGYDLGSRVQPSQ
jgi:hypothetical protein